MAQIYFYTKNGILLIEGNAQTVAEEKKGAA